MNETKHYQVIEPEVPGGWADDIVVDRSIHPPEVKILSVVFDGWLGDDLLEIFPSFLVTEKLAGSMYDEGLQGFEFREARVSTSGQFHEIYGKKELPRFLWLYPFRESPPKDVSLTKDGSLILSDRAMEVFKDFKISNSEISPFEE